MLNKVMLIGNLGRDPETHYTQTGVCVVNFSLATTEKWKNKDGESQERTEWHRIVVWNKLAELCGTYLAKGRRVYVEGKLRTREWTAQDETIKRTTEIVASNVLFLSKKEERTNSTDTQNPMGKQELDKTFNSSEKSANFEDDIPF